MSRLFIAIAVALAVLFRITLRSSAFKVLSSSVDLHASFFVRNRRLFVVVVSSPSCSEPELSVADSSDDIYSTFSTAMSFVLSFSDVLVLDLSIFLRCATFYKEISKINMISIDIDIAKFLVVAENSREKCRSVHQKYNVFTSLVAHTARAYLGFCRMMWL